MDPNLTMPFAHCTRAQQVTLSLLSTHPRAQALKPGLLQPDRICQPLHLYQILLTISEKEAVFGM